MRWIAQIFGVGAMLSLFFMYQQKSRGKILVAKLSADLFWVLHYLFLGGTAGMIPNFVGIFREIVFLQRKRRKWADRLFWPILFVLVNLGLGVASFEQWADLLPILASGFVTVSLWIDHPQWTKRIGIPVSLAFLVYDLTVGSYVGMINESIAIGSILLSFTKERKKR